MMILLLLILLLLLLLLIIIITTTTTLKPRHSVTIHIRPAPFTVSPHSTVTNLHASSPSPNPYPQCPVDSRFLPLWESQNILTHCQKSLIYMIWKKSRHSVFRTPFLPGTGTELFKTNENWTVPGKFGTNRIPKKNCTRIGFLNQ